ncbi:MAG: 16S rRNA (adenine(1518)-N(6)/adenine(1519)-N(6))-dimethyltransferase RsmA [bacterium]|nr:16S rRNA (adenine(1518)-N(6)/adenine(1519)-N(6))-dimethyltransferase RsmA [bacterium]
MSYDLSDLQQLKRYLHDSGLFAKKSLGQHFLVNSAVLDRIVQAADLRHSDHVLEVGPGPGVLSQRLASACGRLTCLELDQRMIAPWKRLMKKFPQAQILHQDALTYVPEDQPYKLVANIPYFITSPLLKHFLREQGVRRPRALVFLIQKEVAERICSEKKPTLLSWEVRVYGKPRLICAVPPTSFYPPPQVDSAVLMIEVLDQPLIEEQLADDFFTLLSCAYHQPRKTLLNNFSVQFKKEDIQMVFDKLKIDPGLRPHQLELEQWKRVFTSLRGF